MEEIKLNMENLTKEEREQLLKLVEKANKKESKVWRPSLNEEYYTVNYKPFAIDRCKDGICVKLWNSSYADDTLYDLGLCFKTPEEAKFAYERQKLIAELERFAKENNEHSGYCVSSCLFYNRSKHKVECHQLVDQYYPTSLIFSSPQVGVDAIKTIGEDRLIKYYFGIKD